MKSLESVYDQRSHTTDLDVAIGVRIKLSRFALLFYPQLAAMYHDWDIVVPKTLGRLVVGYMIIDIQRSALSSGAAVSTKPDDLHESAALGLKLRLPNERE